MKMMSEKQVKRAIRRLEKTQEGRFAKEALLAGESIREIIHTYDLEIGDIEALHRIRVWKREAGELPESDE